MPKLQISPTLLSAALDHSRSNPRGGYKIGDRTHEKAKWSGRIKRLRTMLNCTQKEFADRYGIELRTLQNWEQGGRLPDNSSRAFLTVIENDPDNVRKTLHDARQQEPELAD